MNPRSGKKDLSPETLCDQFSRHGCECIVTLLEPRTDLAALHASDPADIAWIASGGDGTVNAVAHVLAGTGRIMGVLPAGTLNHFCQDLGVPATLEEAVELAATGTPRPVDAAEVNGLTFVNNSSLGFYPAMVLARDRMCRRGAAKWWSMAIASVRAFIRFRLLRISLEVDGSLRTCTTALFFAGNNLYAIDGEGAGKRKRLDAGMLSIFLVPNPSRMCMMRIIAAALSGKARSSNDLDMFHVEHVVVDSPRRRLAVSLDGEVHGMQPPLRYTSRPGALLVIAPAVEAETPEAALQSAAAGSPR